MKSARKFIALVLGLVLPFMTIEPAFAAQVQKFILQMSDTRPGVSSTHTWTFTHTSSSTLKSINLNYCTDPSGGCTKPTNLVSSVASKGTLVGLTDGDWTLNVSGSQPRLEDTNPNGDGVNALTKLSLPINNVYNSSIGDCHSATNSSTDTCYVQLTTYSDATGVTAVDQGIASYTVVSAVVVSARVDPTFSFTVSLVGSGINNNGITTSVASTYNTLNFGNLTANTPKYAAHKLNVTTNTENGYTVTMKMLTQMAGVYTNNNIDPFAAPAVSWGSPVAWALPTGTTPNDNTAWIGANTTDTDVSGWNSSPQGKFGPVNNTENTVMSGSRSDDGSTSIYVTYAIEANVFQPADTYTGTLIYNALPTY